MNVISNPAVHLFDTTSRAYDATQTRDDIRDGDVLVVESESVVGFLCAAWPVAITDEHGSFHTLAADADVACLGKREAKHEGTAFALPADPGTDYTRSVAVARDVLDEIDAQRKLDAELSDEQRAYFAAHDDERELRDEFPEYSRVEIIDVVEHRHGDEQRVVGTGVVLGYVLGWIDTGSPSSGPGPVERCELVRVALDEGGYRDVFQGDLHRESPTAPTFVCMSTYTGHWATAAGDTCRRCGATL